MIKIEQTADEIEAIRHHTQSGRPLGDERFIKRIERVLGYPVRLKSRGRPQERSIVMTRI